MDVKFDFNKLTARRMTSFYEAARKGDYAGIAEFFAGVVTGGTEEWGNPDDVNTYLDMPLFPHLKGIIKAFTDEARESSKN